MIKKTLQLNGLSEMYNRVDFVDSTENADYTFGISDLPKKMYLGKNSFRIKANENFLQSNNRILIDIISKDGRAIYYEVSNVVNLDRSRTVVIYIYEDTPIGEYEIYIGSTLSRNPLTGESIDNNFRDINVIWKSSGIISTSDITLEKPIFSKPPRIEYKNVQIQRRVFDNSRLIQIDPRDQGRIYISSKPNVYTLPDNDVDLDWNLVDSIPSIRNGVGITYGPNIIPSHTPPIIAEVQSFEFSSSMEGGMITIRDIFLTGSNGTIYQSPDYSASILRVRNNRSIELFPPFQYTTADGIQFTTLKGLSNFTASYYETSGSRLDVTQSYLRMDLWNIDPIVGSVDKIGIRYKPVGDSGEYIDLGRYPIDYTEMISDSSSLEIHQEGVREKRLGFLDRFTDPSTYWIFTQHGTGSITSTIVSNDLVQHGIRAVHTAYPNEKSYLDFRLSDRYVYDYPNETEYELTFTSVPGRNLETFSSPQMDVYISGSSVITEIDYIRKPLIHIDSDQLGFYLGSVVGNISSSIDTTFKFKTTSQGKMSPVFVVRAGEWDVGKISLKPAKNKGYTQNHSKIYVPISDLSVTNELVFIVDYYNPIGTPANLSQKLTGLIFTRNEPNITVQDIFGPNVSYQQYGTGSSVMNRLNLGNPGQFNIFLSSSLGESSRISYITQSFFTGSFASVAPKEFSFPIFKDNFNNAQYDPTSSSIALSFDIRLSILGKTGSFSNLIDFYTWSSTIQGRATVNSIENSQRPLIYQTIALSGSYGQLGSFGPGPFSPKVNLDSWHYAGIKNPHTSTDSLVLSYNVLPTSSFNWDFYVTATCDVLKFDTRH